MGDILAAQDAVFDLANKMAALPMEQWRGCWLDLLQALERRRSDDPVAFAQFMLGLELDLKQWRANGGRWPGSGRRVSRGNNED